MEKETVEHKEYLPPVLEGDVLADTSMPPIVLPQLDARGHAAADRAQERGYAKTRYNWIRFGSSRKEWEARQKRKHRFSPKMRLLAFTMALLFAVLIYTFDRKILSGFNMMDENTQTVAAGFIISEHPFAIKLSTNNTLIKGSQPDFPLNGLYTVELTIPTAVSQAEGQSAPIQAQAEIPLKDNLPAAPTITARGGELKLYNIPASELNVRSGKHIPLTVAAYYTESDGNIRAFPLRIKTVNNSIVTMELSPEYCCKANIPATAIILTAGEDIICSQVLIRKLKPS